MDSHRKLTESQRAEAADVVAWFSSLVHSWYVNNLSEAGRAEDELNRLGFQVRIARPRRTLRNKYGEDSSD